MFAEGGKRNKSFIESKKYTSGYISKDLKSIQVQGTKRQEYVGNKTMFFDDLPINNSSESEQSFNEYKQKFEMKKIACEFYQAKTEKLEI